MKFRLIVIASVLVSSSAYSQFKNNLSLVYGAANNIVDIHNVIGDFGYNPENGVLFGLSYIRNITSSFSVVSGIIYSDNKAQLTMIDGPRGESIYNEQIKMISVPLLVQRNFLKYFYANFGLTIDMETNYPNDGYALNQSGIGYEMSIGGHYSVGRLSLFAAPFFQAHGLARFNDNNTGNLLDAGVKFGAGYNF